LHAKKIHAGINLKFRLDRDVNGAARGVQAAIKRPLQT
jgi:hypothetical protein